MKNSLYLTGCFFISILFIFHSNQAKSNTEISEAQEKCRKFVWQNIKLELTSRQSNTDNSDSSVYNYISNCEVTANQLNEIINVYKIQKQEQIRRNILSALNDNKNLVRNQYGSVKARIAVK